MLFLCWFALLLQIVQSVTEKHLLLLGDSVDRNAQHEWCQENNEDVEKSQNNWGDMTIKYSGYPHSPGICSNPLTNDTIAAVHLFGSNGDGPYYHVTPLPGNIHGTNHRIRRALQSYN